MGGGGSSAASSRTQSNEVCLNWNNGGCSDPCLAGRKHVCSVCGLNHRKIDCQAFKSNAGNKGGGKGSSGGGGGAPTNKTKANKKKTGGKGGAQSSKK